MVPLENEYREVVTIVTTCSPAVVISAHDSPSCLDVCQAIAGWLAGLRLGL